MYDMFSNISTNIKLRLKVSENENTLAYCELREKSFYCTSRLFHLNWYILLVYNMFLSILAIKLRQEVSDGKNTLAYYEMREKSFIVQSPFFIWNNIFY